MSASVPLMDDLFLWKIPLVTLVQLLQRLMAADAKKKKSENTSVSFESRWNQGCFHLRHLSRMEQNGAEWSFSQ